MNILKKIRLAIPLFFAAVTVLLSCGMDDYPYLPSAAILEDFVIILESNSKATITIPYVDEKKYPYFEQGKFTLLYRIYMSNLDIGVVQPQLPSTASQEFYTINPLLASDYNAIKPYTDTTSKMGNTTIGSVFNGQSYYELVIENNVAIPRSGSNEKKRIVLDFPIDTNPMVTINGGTARLFRSEGPGSNDIIQNQSAAESTPYPNNSFRYDARLNNKNVPYNKDVALYNNDSTAGKYAYVAFYIVLTALDDTYKSIFSMPTFVGVFKLP